MRRLFPGSSPRQRWDEEEWLTAKNKSGVKKGSNECNSRKFTQVSQERMNQMKSFPTGERKRLSAGHHRHPSLMSITKVAFEMDERDNAAQNNDEAKTTDTRQELKSPKKMKALFSDTKQDKSIQPSSRPFISCYLMLRFPQDRSESRAFYISYPNALVISPLISWSDHNEFPDHITWKVGTQKNVTRNCLLLSHEGREMTKAEQMKSIERDEKRQLEEVHESRTPNNWRTNNNNTTTVFPGPFKIRKE